MVESETITSLKAAKECINAAIKNLLKKEPYSALIAIDNSAECLKSARKRITNIMK